MVSIKKIDIPDVFRITSYNLLIIILLLLVFFANEVFARGPKGEVRVGIFPLAPFNYVGDDGIAHGLNPDILREIVKDEEWKLVFVEGSWAEGLERLESEDIDLMMMVAYAEERTAYMDYNYESVAQVWGQIFNKVGSKINNISDLHGEVVAVMKKDINGKNFIKTALELGVECQIVEFQTHHEVFQAVKDNIAVAGVAPQYFGYKNQNKYELVSSSIVFSPISVYFTTKKGRHHELLSHIDAHLSKWKLNKDSVYYSLLNDWLGHNAGVATIPLWLLISFSTTVFCIVILVSFSLVLRKTIKSRTDELRDQEEQYRIMVNMAGEGILAADADNIITFANPKMLSMTGYSENELVGFKSEKLIFSEDIAEHQEKLRVRKEKVLKQKYERRLRCKNDNDCWVLISAIGLRDDKGNYKGSFATMTDITERKEGEKKLIESHERFLTVLDGIDATIYVADLETNKILFMNKRMVDIFGKDLTGQVCWSALRNKDKRCANCQIDKLFNNKGEPEGVLVREDQHPITSRWNIYSERGVKWVDGRLARIQIATDITKIKELEADKRAYEKGLQQAQRLESLGTFTGGIAHDFNNILAAIIGYTELAIDDEFDKESPAIESMLNVLTAADRASSLVKMLLSFSKRGEGAITPISIKEIAIEVLELIKVTLPSNIVIESKLSCEYEHILGNATQVHQVIMNLCRNAGQAIQGENGILSVSLENLTFADEKMYGGKILPPGSYVELRVYDSGNGIDPKIIDRIFDPFFSTKEKNEGTGLGLSVTHGIVTSLGGSISVESELNEGTTFYVIFPATNEHSVTRINNEEELVEGSENIMLVDDEEAVGKLYQKTLSNKGYKVTLFQNSIDALNAFKQDPGMYDLVITDQTMPHLSGDRLTKELLAIRPALPIILCTGYSEYFNEEAAIQMGVKKYLTKPVRKQQLLSTVRTVLDKEV